MCTCACFTYVCEGETDEGGRVRKRWRVCVYVCVFSIARKCAVVTSTDLVRFISFQSVRCTCTGTILWFWRATPAINYTYAIRLYSQCRHAHETTTRQTRPPPLHLDTPPAHTKEEKRMKKKEAAREKLFDSLLLFLKKWKEKRMNCARNGKWLQ